MKFTTTKVDVIQVRVSKSEKEKWNLFAESHGIKIPQMIRDIVNHVLDNPHLLD